MLVILARAAASAITLRFFSALFRAAFWMAKAVFEAARRPPARVTAYVAFAQAADDSGRGEAEAGETPRAPPASIEMDRAAAIRDFLIAPTMCAAVAVQNQPPEQPLPTQCLSNQVPPVLLAAGTLLQPEVFFDSRNRRISHRRAIGEHQRRHRAVPVVESFDQSCRSLVGLDVDLQERDTCSLKV